MLAIFFAVLATTPALGQQTKSLYQRIGGYDAIAAVTDDFIVRLVSDPSLARFFSGHGNEGKMRIRQHVVEFVCQATGGPCHYTGRDMRSTHQGLGITEEQFNTGGKHFVATLEKFKVPAAEQAELMALIGKLKSDIVEK
jgi:hemoglobin